VRIAVFHNKPYYLRYYETALAALLDRGHHLVLAAPDRFDLVKVPPSLRECSGISTALYPRLRADGLDHAIEIVRIARDAARYLAPELREASGSKELAFRRLARAVGAETSFVSDLGRLPQLERAAEEKVLDGLFGELERLIPPDEELLRFIQSQQLDLVVSISRVNVGGPQTDVVKCAMALGIPTGIAVYSWDNLTAGGVLHEHPDRLFVWNEIQVREAAELHGYDPARAVVTGAPRFDPVFEREPSGSRADLLQGLGLDPARATILYLGSSAFVSPLEPEFVTAWSTAIRSSADGRVREANILVRQHPQTLEKTNWLEWDPPEGIVITPRVARTRAQDLFDQLWASDAVVALNTSAEIEAAIIGKPVLTIKTGEMAPGQEGQLNFEHLLEDRGGFVQAAASIDEHVSQLGEALADDPLADRRIAFLKSFVRPRGLDVRAGLVLAEEIERLAVERDGLPVDRSARERPGDLLRRAGSAAPR
jgi:hypothetical protein